MQHNIRGNDVSGHVGNMEGWEKEKKGSESAGDEPVWSRALTLADLSPIYCPYPSRSIAFVAVSVRFYVSGNCPIGILLVFSCTPGLAGLGGLALCCCHIPRNRLKSGVTRTKQK